MDEVKDIVVSIISLLALAGMLYLLRTNRQQLLATLTGLIQQAETAIEGSGLGATKKEWVLSQLQVIGIKITASIDLLIDAIVEQLNKEGGWLVDAVKRAAGKKGEEYGNN
ncbi:MAG: hypothetical protein AB9835_04875 [Eubacteriales bacterium]